MKARDRFIIVKNGTQVMTLRGTQQVMTTVKKARKLAAGFRAKYILDEIDIYRLAKIGMGE